MAIDHRQLWTDATSANNEAQAIQTLSDILVNKEGRVFLSRLDSRDAELCVEILDNVSRDLHPIRRRLEQFRQGVTGRNLKPIEERAVLITLRKLAERHGLLPFRIRIKERIEISEEALGSGGFGDVKSGTYKGRRVAVKIMRISAKDDFARIRKVSIDIGLPEHASQPSYPSNFTGRSSSGARCPIETFWDSSEFRRT